MYIYIYIYREREREHACVLCFIILAVQNYVAAHRQAMPFAVRARADAIPSPEAYAQKCTSKGIDRQGIVLEHGISLQKEPMPCPPMPLLVLL